tara:strand:- start:3855 stop:5192 length:1338 start_codon:yes stop_codon:yes gene_type:complete
MSLGDIFSGYIEEDLRIRRDEDEREKLKAEKEADRLQRIEDQKMMYGWTANFNNRLDAQNKYDTEYKANKQIVSNMIADLDGKVASVNFLIQKQGFQGAQETIAKLKSASESTSGIRSPISYLPSKIVELSQQEGRTTATLEQLTNFVTQAPSILEIKPTTLPSVGEIKNLSINRLELNQPTNLAEQPNYYKNIGITAYTEAQAMEDGPEKDKLLKTAYKAKSLSVLAQQALDYDPNSSNWSKDGKDYEKFNNIMLSLLVGQHSPDKAGDWTADGLSFVVKGLEQKQTTELNIVATYLTDLASAAIDSGMSYADVKSYMVDYITENQKPRLDVFQPSETDSPFKTQVGGSIVLATGFNSDGTMIPPDLLDAKLFPDSPFNPNKINNSNVTTVPDGTSTSLMDTLMRDYQNAQTPSERRAIIQQMNQQESAIKDPWIALGNVIPTS